MSSLEPHADTASAMLGVIRVRERLVALYSPETALSVALDRPRVALVTALNGRRVALAADDVLDAMDADLATVQPAPAGAHDALGLVRSGRELVTLLDWDALVARCVGGAMEGE